MGRWGWTLFTASLFPLLQGCGGFPLFKLFSDTDGGVIYGSDLTKQLARIMNLTKDNENITDSYSQSFK